MDENIALAPVYTAYCEYEFRKVGYHTPLYEGWLTKNMMIHPIFTTETCYDSILLFY